MRRFLHLSLLLTGCFTLAANAQNKHALLFAIGDYKPATNWEKISSANDVPYMQKALINQGFPEKNIAIVKDAAATRSGIDMALKSLLNKVKTGDIVVIHFSSHGVQIEDDNADEIDQMDESIVPYDATYPADMKEFAKYQDKYFRDDQFGKYINQLRAKLGVKGDVIVFIDACHSGSGTRGMQKVRGGKPALKSPGFVSGKKPATNTAEVFLEKDMNESELATYIVFSAARAEELNYEMTTADDVSMGSLSYAISSVLEKLKPGTTYRSLFANVLAVMNEEVPDQRPVLEGNGSDRLLFGGNFVAQKPYVEVASAAGKSLTLKAGLMNGLDVGAKVAVYAGTNDPAGLAPLANGTIEKAEPFNAIVQLDKDLGMLQPAAAWVFVTEPVFKSDPLVVNILSDSNAGGFSAAERLEIAQTLKEFPLVKMKGQPELIITNGPEKDSVLIAGNGLMFGTFKDKDMLKQQIQQYIQFKFLQKLVIEDDLANMEVRLAPLINGKPDTSYNNPKMVNGILEVDSGDVLIVMAKNKGSIPVYLNILDLQPDGLINPILPNSATTPKITKTELKINGGETKVFDKYKIIIGPPYGMETFKIFVSRDEIDMEAIAKSAAARTRGNLSVLQQLVGSSYTAATRGSHVENATKSEGSAYNIVFRIKPAKK